MVYGSPMSSRYELHYPTVFPVVGLRAMMLRIISCFVSAKDE